MWNGYNLQIEFITQKYLKYFVYKYKMIGNGHLLNDDRGQRTFTSLTRIHFAMFS